MKLVDREETILIVIGEATDAGGDRTVAVTLCREIDSRADGQAYRRAVIVGDIEFLDRPELHRHPTIVVGGPGANVLAQRFVRELPTLWQQEDRCFVQAELDESRRVALWGADATATSRAADAFLSEGFLEVLLDRVWRTRPTTQM